MIEGGWGEEEPGKVCEVSVNRSLKVGAKDHKMNRGSTGQGIIQVAAFCFREADTGVRGTDTVAGGNCQTTFGGTDRTESIVTIHAEEKLAMCAKEGLQERKIFARRVFYRVCERWPFGTDMAKRSDRRLGIADEAQIATRDMDNAIGVVTPFRIVTRP